MVTVANDATMWLLRFNFFLVARYSIFPYLHRSTAEAMGGTVWETGASGNRASGEAYRVSETHCAGGQTGPF